MSELVEEMAGARQRFMDFVSDVRPELHRYCARMTGSIFDGEDVVQETLAKAFYALAELEAPPPLRPWLFRIAHNTALDFLRRGDRKHVEAELLELAIPDVQEPDAGRVEAALHLFASLPPLQRSALAFKDVLGLSLEETAANMGVSVLAVKSALSRARARLAEQTSQPTTRAGEDLQRLRSYAHLFNARDWDGLRQLFDSETKLELISRHQRRGRGAAEYFTRYAAAAPQEDLRVEVGFVDGLAVLAMFRPASSPQPTYFIQLVWNAQVVALVRDFRHVPYIAREANFTRAHD
jgi:RNA polymerase sigma-70 factor (ECF subfamily)